jgi:hypothetical protein
MLWWVIFSYSITRALCSGLHIRERGFKRWSKSWEGCFAGFLFGHFRGMFWNYISARGEIDTPATSMRWSSMECRRRIAQKIARKLGRLFFAILGCVFLGDVLYFVQQSPKKYYAVIEFKVISIIYITEFVHYEPRRK